MYKNLFIHKILIPEKDICKMCIGADDGRKGRSSTEAAGPLLMPRCVGSVAQIDVELLIMV